MLFICHIETNKCTITSNVLANVLLSLHSLKFNLEEGTGIIDITKQVLLLDIFPGEAKVNQFDHIYILLESNGIVIISNSEIKGREETANSCSLSKCDNISRICQIPVFTTPEFSSWPNTSLSLIDNEGDVFFLCDSSQLSIEVRCCHLILEGWNGLNDYSSHVFLNVSSLLNDILEGLDASVFFSSVLMLIICHGILDLREGSKRPIILRDLLEINLRITAW